MRTILTAAALLLAATAPATAQRGAPDPERAAARQLVLEMATNIQAGKWAAVDSLFPARGLHVLADTTAYHSWADYRDKALKPDLARYTGLKYAHTSVEAVVRGTVGWVAFRQEVGGATSPASSPRIGRGSVVLEKLDGKWTIVQLHISR